MASLVHVCLEFFLMVCVTGSMSPPLLPPSSGQGSQSPRIWTLYNSEKCGDTGETGRTGSTVLARHLPFLSLMVEKSKEVLLKSSLIWRYMTVTGIASQILLGFSFNATFYQAYYINKVLFFPHPLFLVKSNHVRFNQMFRGYLYFQSQVE